LKNNLINSPIYLEVIWIRKLILNAIKITDTSITIEPPRLPEDFEYNRYLIQVQASLYERVLLALAHCFQMIPRSFEILKLEQETGIDSCGIIEDSSSGLPQPTIHTANWLCEIYNIEIEHMDEHHYLHTGGMLESFHFYPSIFMTPLILSKKARYLFYRKTQYLPEKDLEFTIPDFSARFYLWKKVFAKYLKISDDSFHYLAKTYEITEENIVNVLRFVVLYTSETKEEISLNILKEGVRREYHKQGLNMPLDKLG